MLEHECSHDPWLPVWLLGYMTRIWEGLIDRKEVEAGRLPPILPAVVYHGEKGWQASTQFEAVIDLPEDAPEAIRAHIPRFRFALDDLTATSLEALRQREASLITRAALLRSRKPEAPRPSNCWCAAWPTSSGLFETSRMHFASSCTILWLSAGGRPRRDDRHRGQGSRPGGGRGDADDPGSLGAERPRERSREGPARGPAGSPRASVAATLRRLARCRARADRSRRRGDARSLERGASRRTDARSALSAGVSRFGVGRRITRLRTASAAVACSSGHARKRAWSPGWAGAGGRC